MSINSSLRWVQRCRGLRVRSCPAASPNKSVWRWPFTLEKKGLKEKSILGGGFNLGKWSNLTNIFLMGWNHQLEFVDPIQLIPKIRNWQDPVVATQRFFDMFTPISGEMIQFDEHIFQTGWFNHQLDILQYILCLPRTHLTSVFRGWPAPFDGSLHPCFSRSWVRNWGPQKNDWC